MNDNNPNNTKRDERAPEPPIPTGADPAPKEVTRAQQPEAITGVEAMMGKGVKEPLGFWADAWSQVIRRPGAVLGLTWVAIVAFFAIFAPVIASGHPVVMRTIDTRTGNDAARWVDAELAKLQTTDQYGEATGAVGPKDIQQAVRLELQRHAPSMSPDDILGDTDLPTQTVQIFDETGRSEPKQAVDQSTIERVLETLASSTQLDETGGVARVTSPLISSLSASDIVILLGSILGAAVLLWPASVKRSTRALWIIAGSAQSVIIVVLAGWVGSKLGARDAPAWLLELQRLGLTDNPAPDDWRWFVTLLVTALSALTTILFMIVPTGSNPRRRLAVHAVACLVSAVAVGYSWGQPPERFDYPALERAGEIRATYTIIPFSPTEKLIDRNASSLPPGSSTDQALARRLTTGLPFRGVVGEDAIESVIRAAEALPLDDEPKAQLIEQLEAAAEQMPEQAQQDIRDAREGLAGTEDLPPPTRLANLRVGELESYAESLLAGQGREFLLGTDASGKDVLSQMLHACRHSVSIGLVATGIAAFIGITLGAIMGYFGGIVDLVLYRVVEIFMAIPVLFLLIVAAAVLPRNTYVMMAIIGCFTWHSIARFTRAEFYKLRNQDFVQSAQAVGLPLHSVLFKHMLPNGVTPVLVDASFRIALAILFETILSYLALGPEDQASWGRLLYDATRGASGFDWWLAMYPGFAIFLTVLGYNLIGEALRDAIDPKLKKARV